MCRARGVASWLFLGQRVAQAAPGSRGLCVAVADERLGRVAAGINLYELSRYMGASVRVLEMHYAHLVDGAEDAARAKLDARATAVLGL